jgi:hypothetical protein
MIRHGKGDTRLRISSSTHRLLGVFPSSCDDIVAIDRNSGDHQLCSSRQCEFELVRGPKNRFRARARLASRCSSLPNSTFALGMTSEVYATLLCVGRPPAFALHQISGDKDAKRSSVQMINRDGPVLADEVAQHLHLRAAELRAW